MTDLSIDNLPKSWRKIHQIIRHFNLVSWLVFVGVCAGVCGVLILGGAILCHLSRAKNKKKKHNFGIKKSWNQVGRWRERERERERDACSGH